MKRSSFLKASIVGAALPSIMPGSSHASPANTQKNAKRQLYELRTYLLTNATQEKIIDEYLEKAAIPALNRLGAKHVGVFKEMKPAGQTKIIVLIPFASIDAFMELNDKLLKDADYQAAGAAYINAPATAPAYDRIESSLLYAFAKLPEMVIPANKDRIFELRRYESASELAGQTKIKVFNDEGEIDIFKSVGLTPVFFGETLIGALRPNLTYMLTYDDMAAHDRNWKKFGGDPRWQKIKAVPAYADAQIVSHITAVFLLPTAYSQV